MIPYRVDIEIKKKIIQLRNDGLPITDVANEVGVARNTVYRWLERWQQEGALSNHVSFGRPRSTTRRLDMDIINQAREERFINTTQFANQYQVSSSTIGRRLKEGGLQNRVPARKPALTDRHKEDRLQFAARYLNHNFNKVIFMDEKVFCSADNGRMSLWRPDNTRYLEQNVVRNRQSGRITIGFWGWMCKDGPGELVEITGRMNAVDYKEILEESFLPTAQVFYPNEHITFMQDNSSVHNARLVQGWINDHRDVLTRIKMPAKSPDLNPIENLWGKMVQGWDGNQCPTTSVNQLK